MDEKILAVPIDKITQVNRNVRTYRDIPEIDLARIAHFFEHYKDLEPNKWVKVLGWEGPERAHRLILEGIERAQGQAGATGEKTGGARAMKRKIIPGVIDGEQALCCLAPDATAWRRRRYARARVGAVMVVEAASSRGS